MTIDSQSLRVFCALARHLNLSRAAEELGLTPSGISHGLKALENDLGCRLFERTSRKVSLTPAGAEFRHEADAILAKMAAARAKVKAWSDWRCGQLRVAADPACCQHVLPLALREFRESFPKFTVRIDPCASRALETIAEDRADLALLVRPQRAPGYEFIPLAEDELHYLVHPRHPWATQRKADREGLARQNLILPERSGETYALIERYFRQEGVRLSAALEIGHEESMKYFVQLNLGIALLPRWLAAQELAAGALVAIPVGRRKLRRQWGILHAKSHPISFPESVLVDLCRNVTQSLMREKS